MYCSLCDNTKQLEPRPVNYLAFNSPLDSVIRSAVAEWHCDQCGEIYYSFGKPSTKNHDESTVMEVVDAVMTEHAGLLKRLGEHG